MTQSAQPSSQSSLPFRVFKTPGLRTPAAKEQVYNISINGSPLADSKEISLSVPIGGGAVSGTLERQATVQPLSSLSCLPTLASETEAALRGLILSSQSLVFSPRLEAHLPFSCLLLPARSIVCGVCSSGH
jgi:hypothetical protein